MSQGLAINTNSELVDEEGPDLVQTDVNQSVWQDKTMWQLKYNENSSIKNKAVAMARHITWFPNPSSASAAVIEHARSAHALWP